MEQPNTFFDISTKHSSIYSSRSLITAAIKFLAKCFIYFTTFWFLFGFTVMFFASLDPSTVVHVDLKPSVGISIIVVVIILYIIWSVASGKKKVILYLRRFREKSANDALSSAMYKSLRNIGRLVVLDDSSFKSIAIPLRERVMIVLSALPGITALLLVFALGASVEGPVVYMGDGLNYRAESFISITSGLSHLNEMDDMTDYSETPVLLTFPGAIGVWLLLAVLGIMVFRSFFSGWEARRSIGNDDDIKKLIRRVKYLSNWLTAPKAIGSLATVTKVENTKWQDVVTRLASQVSSIVLDISHPSDAIWWELLHCLEHYPDKLLIIMNAQDNYLSGNTGDFSHYDELADHIAKSPLEGVLMYDLSTKSTRKQFYKSLGFYIKNI